MPRDAAFDLRPALAAALLAMPAAAATGPWHETPEARVRLVSRWAAAAPGGDGGLGVEFALAPGWHVYWKNAGDAGYPPEIAAKPGSPVEGLALRYPAPERFDLAGGLVAFGYEREVIYPLDGRWAGALGGDLAVLVAQLDYLVCAEKCIPYRADLALELPVGEAVPDPETAPRLDAWSARLPRAVGGADAPRVTARLQAARGPELELVLELAAPGLVAASPELFFEPHGLLRIGRPRFVAASAAGPGFRVPVAPVDETQPLPARLTFAWTATGIALGSTAGPPSAWEGTLELERPRTGAERRGWVLAAIGFALVALAVFALRARGASRRRGAPPTPSPTN